MSLDVLLFYLFTSILYALWQIIVCIPGKINTLMCVFLSFIETKEVVYVLVTYEPDNSMNTYTALLPSKRIIP